MIILDHWNCTKCGKDNFHVVLGKGKFKVAKIVKIICSNCGMIFKNENQEAKKRGR